MRPLEYSASYPCRRRPAGSLGTQTGMPPAQLARASPSPQRPPGAQRVEVRPQPSLKLPSSPPARPPRCRRSADSRLRGPGGGSLGDRLQARAPRGPIALRRARRLTPWRARIASWRCSGRWSRTSRPPRGRGAPPRERLLDRLRGARSPVTPWPAGRPAHAPRLHHVKARRTYSSFSETSCRSPQSPARTGSTSAPPRHVHTSIRRGRSAAGSGGRRPRLLAITRLAGRRSPSPPPPRLRDGVSLDDLEQDWRSSRSASRAPPEDPSQPYVELVLQEKRLALGVDETLLELLLIALKSGDDLLASARSRVWE